MRKSGTKFNYQAGTGNSRDAKKNGFNKPPAMTATQIANSYKKQAHEDAKAAAKLN